MWVKPRQRFLWATKKLIPIKANAPLAAILSATLWGAERQEIAMNVADVMTSPVISVTPTTTVAEAAQLMLQHRISGLPVVDAGGTVVGIVTEGDLLRRTETGTERQRPRWLEFLVSPGRLADDYAHAHARWVGEAMSTDIIAVTPQDDLAQAVRLMERRHVKRLPVIDAGRLVGIVSRANLVRALVQNIPQPEGTGVVSDDATIRARIREQIDAQPWGPRASVDVRVENGVVELFGSITDERERNALKVLAENVAGVKEVRDRLVWVDAVSGYVIPQPPADAA